MSSEWSKPWWYRFIETPDPIDRVAALIALEHPSVDVQIEALLRVIFNDWDLRFCEEVVAKIATRFTDGTFPYNVSRALYLLMSSHGEMHSEIIYPLLEHLVQFPEMEWDVRRSLDYIEWWIFRSDVPHDDRSTAQLLARAVAMEPYRDAWARRQRWPRRRKSARVRPVRKRREGRR